jgi:hypothetical protein
MPEIQERHHQRRKCRRQAPYEAVLEIRERRPSMLKNINGGPLGDGASDP